jgi:hypothetical protein
MPLFQRKTVIVADLEGTYGTDPGAATAVKASNVSIRPMEGSDEERDFQTDTLGGQPTIPVGTHQVVSFEVELAGGGAAGTAPGYGDLLRACGMDETVTAATDVVYAPVSDTGDSATLHVNLDGNRHVLLGARGTFDLRLNAGGLPKLAFTFTGLWAAPSAAALPAVDFSAYQDGIPVSKANTPTFDLHGYSAVVSELSFSFGNEIVYEDLINAERVDRTDRRVSGSVTLETPALGDFDPFTAAKNGTLGAMQLVHGTAAGAIVQIDAPKVQLQQPSFGNRSGKSTLSLNLRCTPDAGDDEFTLTVK